jgi:hypothetical protein
MCIVTLLHKPSQIGYSGIGYSGIDYSGIDYSDIGYSGIGYSGIGYSGIALAILEVALGQCTDPSSVVTRLKRFPVISREHFRKNRTNQGTNYFLTHIWYLKKSGERLFLFLSISIYFAIFRLTCVKKIIGFSNTFSYNIM